MKSNFKPAVAVLLGLMSMQINQSITFIRFRDVFIYPSGIDSYSGDSGQSMKVGGSIPNPAATDTVQLDNNMAALRV